MLAGIRIGGASGFWGESDMAVPQFLSASSELDYIVFDYLAEITMSIMARARAKSPDAGYATDFVTDVVAPNLKKIAAGRVKLLSNAGGVNPLACSRQIEQLIKDAGLDLKVATITGDDLTSRAGSFSHLKEMFSGEPFPEPDSIASINAYLGAFPIAEALARGADIVVTGRCADSALTLAACIHEFGWRDDDWDLLAAGSLAGHLIECGPQATGGNHTDWQRIVPTLENIGYPIAVVRPDGELTLEKPADTGGEVTFGTVAEQLVYEIGDPQSYLLPDVTCDFSGVTIEQIADGKVRVQGARGRPATTTYKTSATWNDGLRIITLWFFIGRDAGEKARQFAGAALARARGKLARLNLPDYTEVCVDPFGSGTQFAGQADGNREVALRLAARHPDARALTILLKEATGLALATPPGMALYTGGRPSPSPVVRLFSFLVDKDDVDITITVNGESVGFHSRQPDAGSMPAPDAAVPASAAPEGDRVTVPLRQLAFGRSGDKGNKANIGIIAREPALLPYLWEQLTPDTVAGEFSHFLGDSGIVERFYLPGTAAINFLLHNVLGGGGIASLRADTQGKSYAEILLDLEIDIPRRLAVRQ